MSSEVSVRAFLMDQQQLDRRTTAPPQLKPTPVPEGRPYTNEEFLAEVRWKLRQLDD